MHYKNRFPSAIIQSYPEYKIFRNFQRDTIGTEVIKVIDSLKIRGIYNSGDTTQLEFWHDDEYVILYRNKSYKNVVYYKNRKRIDVVKNWKYFSFQLKTD